MRLTKREAILMAALALSPFTLLRVWRIGPSELFFLWFIADVLYEKKGSISINRHGLARYYLFFLVLCIVGWFYNILSLTNSGRRGTAVFNFAAYALTLLCIIMLEDSITDSRSIRIKPILMYFFWLLSIADCLLYVYSRARPTLFGMRMLYYGRFCPLADNIHQFAMVATPLPFLGMSTIGDYQKLRTKAMCTALCLADAFLASRVGSTKADMGIVIGFVVYCITMIAFHSRMGAKERSQVLLLIASMAGFFCTVFWTRISSYVLEFFSENDNHSARSILYQNSLKTIGEHPLVGLGPASHATNSAGVYHDAHETYLAAGMSGGVFGMAAIVGLMLQAVSMTIAFPPYLAAMVPILIYSGGGDVLRKMGIWVFIMLIAYGAQERAVEDHGFAREN